MEIHQPSLSLTPFLSHPSSSQDNFTQLTHDLSHKLSLHPPPLEYPSHEVPRSEDLVEGHQPKSQNAGNGNEAGEQEEDEGGREGAPKDEDGGDGDDDDSDDDFSFCCERPDGSPVSAEDVFVDGRIRPIFPLFNQSLLLTGEPKAVYPLQPPLRRLFAEDAGECPRVVEEIELPSPGSCKKSNSTGSSKLCRFEDSVVTRSTSDGKDAFVFLRKDRGDSVLTAKRDKGVVANHKVSDKDKGKGKGRKPPSLPSATKGKATEKHRSYLPYRRDLLGFFTNSNLLSKNVHPF